MKELRKAKAAIKQTKLRKQKNPTPMDRFTNNYMVSLYAWCFSGKKY